MPADRWITYGASPSEAKTFGVFVHGRGQSPEAMIPFVLSRVDVQPCHILLPRAPRSSWYDAKATDPITEATRAQLTEAFDLFDRGLERATELGEGAAPILGGFSQGACTVLEYVFARRPRIAGLAILTGCRVGLPDAPGAGTSFSGLPVYASCSDRDPWIPLDAFLDAARHLAVCQTELTCQVVPGRDHSVSDVEAAMLGRMFRTNGAGNRLSFHAMRGQGL